MADWLKNTLLPGVNLAESAHMGQCLDLVAQVDDLS